MGTTIRQLGQMQIEQRELDEDGRRAQEQINQLAMREYEQTGTLSSARLCEAVTEYRGACIARAVSARGC